MHTEFLSDQITRHFAGLSPQLRRAARYVMDHPEEVAMRSLRQVASNSGLSPPTYSRLARAIGFKHYESLRDRCRDGVRQSHLSLAERAAMLQDGNRKNSEGDRGSFAVRHARSAVSNIQGLIDNLDISKLADVADHLATARNVLLIGSMGSRTMVEYLAHMADMAAPNWRVVGQGASSVPAALAGVDENDAVLAIAASPYARRTVEAIQIATTAGAKAVIITDDLRSPVLKYAEFSFLAPTESPQFFPSHVAIVTLIEVIMGMVVRRLGEEGQNRINAVEKTNHAIGDYWQR